MPGIGRGSFVGHRRVRLLRLPIASTRSRCEPTRGPEHAPDAWRCADGYLGRDRGAAEGVLSVAGRLARSSITRTTWWCVCCAGGSRAWSRRCWRAGAPPRLPYLRTARTGQPSARPRRLAHHRAGALPPRLGRRPDQPRSSGRQAVCLSRRAIGRNDAPNGPTARPNGLRDERHTTEF
jgi:hypothetical protein